MDEIAVCPICGGELIVDDTIDFEDDGADLAAWRLGHCDNCNRQFKWEDVYTLSFSCCVEEIEP